MKAVTANAETGADVFRQCVLARARAAAWCETRYRTPRRGARARTVRARAHRIESGWIVQRGESIERAERQRVSGSMSVGVVKRSPPCTMRCATASSSPSSVQRVRSSAEHGIERGREVRCPASCGACRRSRAALRRGRCSRCAARRLAAADSPAITAHLIEELPQLNARMRTVQRLHARNSSSHRPS